VGLEVYEVHKREALPRKGVCHAKHG